MKKHSLKELKEIANLIRQDIINMLYHAKSGHPGGSLGMTDIFTVLYFHTLKHNPQKPNWKKRDRLILSNGHICPVLYSSLARSKYFPLIKLKSLRKINSDLQGHPHYDIKLGIENNGGPLGQGISQAVGISLASQIDNIKNTIYAITSDGEHNEGQTWEAIMLAAKYKLDNLINIVDYNNIQIDGYTKNIMPLKSLAAKYKSFNWSVLEIDGHNMKEIIKILKKAKKIKKRPTVIIAHTIPGKCVEFMENEYIWHGQAPNKEERDKALEQLINCY